MTKKAKALVFKSPERKFELRELSLEEPGNGMVRLELFQSGVCGTDMHFLHGKLALGSPETIIGHEFIGKVDALGEGAKNDAAGKKLTVGDMGIVCVAIPCGKCPNCERGETSSCMAFQVTYGTPPDVSPHLHGGFSEYQFAPASNVIKLPDGIDPEAVSAFPCVGPTVIRAFKYGGGVKQGEFVVVQGTGAMGLFAIAYAKAKGCRVVAIGSMKNKCRIELAEKLGAEKVLDYRATEAERIEKTNELTDAKGADLVIETSGSPASFAEGINLLRIRGRYLVPGQYSNSGGIEIQPQLITFKALQIIGSGQYNLEDVEDYLQFIAENPEIAKIFKECTGTKFKLDDFEQAIAAIEAGETIKAVFIK